MLLGWLSDGTNKYYMDPASGRMTTGVSVIDGYYYYFKDVYKRQEENRQSGFIFLNKHGERITSRGIAGQLKHFAVRYGLDPSVVYPDVYKRQV